MTLDIAQSCIEDPRTEVKELGIRILSDCDAPQAEIALVELMADHDDHIADAAQKVLRVKQPWLELDPFHVRTPSESALQSHLGVTWSAIREAISKSLDQLEPEHESRVLKRWMKLPGIGPDICEILWESGKQELADWFYRESGIYGNGMHGSKQLLVSPTYRCNITCSYCYSKEWEKLHGSDLPIDDLESLFNWSEKQGINEWLLAGGEPTVYRHLAELLQSAKQRSIRIRLTSNGVYNKATRKWVTSEWVDELTGHYDQEIMAQRPEISDLFQANLLSAKESGVEVILRYTLLENSDRKEWQKLIDLATDTDIRRINFGFSFLNVLGNNEESYYRFEPGKVNPQFEKQFMDFVDDCENSGLEVSQSKPLPLCAISPESLGRIINTGILRTSCPAHRREFTQNLTVNPDLTTFPCNAIGVAGARVTDFENLKAAGSFHSELIDRLQNIPLGTSCESCLFFYRGICQGVCLAQHYATNNSESDESGSREIKTDLLQQRGSDTQKTTAQGFAKACK